MQRTQKVSLNQSASLLKAEGILSSLGDCCSSDIGWFEGGGGGAITLGIASKETSS